MAAAPPAPGGAPPPPDASAHVVAGGGAALAGAEGSGGSSGAAAVAGARVGRVVAWVPGLNLGLAHLRLDPTLRHTLPGAEGEGGAGEGEAGPAGAATAATAATAAPDDVPHSAAALAGYKALHARAARREVDLSVPAADGSSYRLVPVLPLWWRLLPRAPAPEEE